MFVPELGRDGNCAFYTALYLKNLHEAITYNQDVVDTHLVELVASQRAIFQTHWAGKCDDPAWQHFFNFFKPRRSAPQPSAASAASSAISLVDLEDRRRGFPVVFGSTPSATPGSAPRPNSEPNCPLDTTSVASAGLVALETPPEPVAPGTAPALNAPEPPLGTVSAPTPCGSVTADAPGMPPALNAPETPLGSVAAPTPCGSVTAEAPGTPLALDAPEPRLGPLLSPLLGLCSALAQALLSTYSTCADPC